MHAFRFLVFWLGSVGGGERGESWGHIEPGWKTCIFITRLTFQTFTIQLPPSFTLTLPTPPPKRLFHTHGRRTQWAPTFSEIILSYPSPASETHSLSETEIKWTRASSQVWFLQNPHDSNIRHNIPPAFLCTILLTRKPNNHKKLDQVFVQCFWWWSEFEVMQEKIWRLLQERKNSKFWERERISSFENLFWTWRPFRKDSLLSAWEILSSLFFSSLSLSSALLLMTMPQPVSSEWGRSPLRSGVKCYSSHLIWDIFQVYPIQLI